MGQPAHHPAAVAGDQGRGLVGEGRQQVGQPTVALGLGEILKHIVHHRVFVARMADTDAHPLIAIADMGVQTAQAVMATRAAAGFDFDLAGFEIEIVVKDGNRGNRQFEKPQGRADRLTGFVHERLGLLQQNALAGDAALAEG